MCCIPACLTSCFGAACGYCSECVGVAACNPTLCGSCITGSTNVVCLPCSVSPVAGSNVGICTNVDVSACLPFAGVDGNGNEIYQQADGSLVYSDGTPATRADIAANCGACLGTPCSPRTCGTTDQPPHGSATSSSGPSGGGGGGGTAKSAGGLPRNSNPVNCVASRLSQAMNRFGSTVASLLSGGKPVPAGSVIPGQKVVPNTSTLSHNAFLLIVIVLGGILLWMAFGHKPEGD